MIFTCTMNPSLDYYMDFDQEIVCGALSRSSMEYYEPGGKGLNVSIVLNNLGMESHALGFAGGFTGDYAAELLEKYGNIRQEFTRISGNTRINVKCSGASLTQLNGAGPYITEEDMNDLAGKVSLLTKEDVLVLAGSTQRYLRSDAGRMLALAAGRGVKVVLDTDPSLMRETVPHGVFLIRTDAEGLSGMFGGGTRTKEDLIRLAKKTHEEGVEYVIVRCAENSSLLVCAEGIYEARVPFDDRTVSLTGAGGSMTAGFLMKLLQKADVKESFRFGFACSSATAWSKGIATKEKIGSVLANVQLQRLD